MASICWRIQAAVAKTFRVAFKYPSSPVASSAAQQAALNPPGRLPANVGERYSPPGQSPMVKYWKRRSSRPRYRITEDPFGA